MEFLKIILSPTYYIYRYLKYKRFSYNKTYVTDNLKEFFMGTAILVLGHLEILTYNQYSKYSFITAAVAFVGCNYFYKNIKEIDSSEKIVNFKFLCMTISTGLLILSLVYRNEIVYSHFMELDFFAIFYIYGLSRVFHLFLSFTTDAYKKISGKKNMQNEQKDDENNKSEDKTNNNSESNTKGCTEYGLQSNLKFRRVSLILRSYINLFLDYGILYYLINNQFIKLPFINYSFFNKPFNNVIEAVYYSVVTITTVGYGDFYPIHTISRIYCITEILGGMFLVAISLVIYLGDLNQKDSNQNNSKLLIKQLTKKFGGISEESKQRILKLQPDIIEEIALDLINMETIDGLEKYK